MSTARSIGSVVAVIGKAYVRNPDGETRPIKPGDVLHEGDVVITSPALVKRKSLFRSSPRRKSPSVMIPTSSSWFTGF